MALNRTNGVFSETMFHPTVFDTGQAGSATPISPEDLNRHRILREDEELMLFIAAIESTE